MSSILTNNSAMVALQTLKSINQNLGKVQSEISTGKTIESAKDNAATWAISKVMESDVAGFKAISDSLDLGQATVGVALNGAESLTDLLVEIKGKIVNSQESNVDRAKIQTDIEALTSQITSIVGAAQFNGLNLLNSDGAVAILSSLDRDSAGAVTANDISVTTTNMGTNDVILDTAGGTTASEVGTLATAATGNTVALTGLTITTGVAYTLDIEETTGTTATTALDTIGAGGVGTATAAFAEMAVVAVEGDTATTIADRLVANFNEYATANGETNLTMTASAGTITFGQADWATGAREVTLAVTSLTADPNGTVENQAAGALFALTELDVTTTEGADTALDSIEGLIQSSINNAASLGSAGRQIDTQANFVGKLTDLLTSGIGTLVDADMEAASAKLQALQTQQQLGVQALSIANQAPQTILSLFR